MDITQLRYFLMTASHLNYTKASDELFLSRQALRQSIQSLENDLGAPLFQNRNNHLSLTSAGQALKEKASPIVAAFDKMEQEIREMNHPFREISLACSLSIRTFILPSLDHTLDEFQEQNPAIPIRTAIVTNDEIWEALQSGDCRFGLMMVIPWASPDFTFLPLQDFTLGINTMDSDLSCQTVLSLSDLTNRRLLGMGSLESSFRPLAKDLKKHGIPVHYESVPDPIDAFYQLKHDGALIFNIAESQPDNAPDISTIPLASYHWPLCLVYRKDPALAHQERLFLRYLQNDLKQNPITFR